MTSAVKPSASDRPNEGLSETHRAVLEVESRYWHHVGAKEAHVRAELGMTPTRYAQVLGWLIDQPAAEAAAPLLVRRLRRLRDLRKAARTRTA